MAKRKSDPESVPDGLAADVERLGDFDTHLHVWSAAPTAEDPYRHVCEVCGQEKTELLPP